MKETLGPTNGNPAFWFPLRHPSGLASSRTVLGGKMG